MNLVVLGLGSAFLLTLGLASSIPPANLAMACIDDMAQSAAISDIAMTATIDDSVPCP